MLERTFFGHSYGTYRRYNAFGFQFRGTRERNLFENEINTSGPDRERGGKLEKSINNG